MQQQGYYYYPQGTGTYGAGPSTTAAPGSYQTAAAAAGSQPTHSFFVYSPHSADAHAYGTMHFRMREKKTKSKIAKRAWTLVSRYPGVAGNEWAVMTTLEREPCPVVVRYIEWNGEENRLPTDGLGEVRTYDTMAPVDKATQKGRKLFDRVIDKVYTQMKRSNRFNSEYISEVVEKSVLHELRWYQDRKEWEAIVYIRRTQPSQPVASGSRS